MKPPRDCPCHSGLRYAACCAPYHRHVALPPTPTALMRSRYSGFAMALGTYLVETLSARHEDLQGGKVDTRALAAELSRHDGRRYLGLTIVHESISGELGEVLFFARIFEKGESRSFAELSTFRLGPRARVAEADESSGGGEVAWGYERGIMLPEAVLPERGGPAALTREVFLAAAEAPRSSELSTVVPRNPPNSRSRGGRPARLVGDPIVGFRAPAR